MMAQWHETKAAHPDCLLFFRMGDFYELFFDDATTAAAALNITLTRRGHHNGAPVPMAGVPVHAAEQYLSRLIGAGHRVAICEQMEDPAEARKRGPKSVVRRAVTRVVTPGTITEETLLDARHNNHLAALARTGSGYGLAWLDISTGELWIQSLAESDIPAALARIAPGELLLADDLAQQPVLFETLGAIKDRLTILPAGRWDSPNAARRLEQLYGVATLDAFGPPTPAETAAAGVVVDYVELTQVGRMPHIARPRRLPPPGAPGAAMEIDAATRSSLELTRTGSGQRQGSLLATVDRTVTGAGARLLAERLAAPLTDLAKIETRLDMVSSLLANDTLRTEVRATLKGMPDLARALSRLGLGRGGPADLGAIRAGLDAAIRLRRQLEATPDLPPGLRQVLDRLGQPDGLVEKLTRALIDNPPALARDGGFIAAGYLPELDRQRALRDESRRLIADLQKTCAQRENIPNLKIRHNNILGYFIEVGAAHADRLRAPRPEGEAFVHRQTMAGTARFSTRALADLGSRIHGAAERALGLEQGLFNDLRNDTLGMATDIGRTAAAMASLDVSAALATLAAAQDYCRPDLTADQSFRIVGGRHPVVAATGRDFIPNDCELDATGGAGMWLLTGPNMAGKSTFLRQNALIAILAQAGSFVPAGQARIGVIDRLFSRVGAADDLARGRSTFMAEMVETAAILAQATAASFVVLDEIGRGTATFDGLSIAWATVEHLHDLTGCRTLFATHYHELTVLSGSLPRLSCHTMRVREWKDDIVFLHEVGAGAADRSYGLHVARLAGLPRSTLERARAILTRLEQGGRHLPLDDLPLFNRPPVAAPPAGPAPPAPVPGPVPEPAPEPAPAPVPGPVEAALTAADPDSLTPRAALELVYKLKKLLANG